MHRFVLFLLLSIHAGSLAWSDDRPHIILVMADDQGWGDMGYNGHPELKTPHFDAAAAQSLRFDRFYAAAPVCSPTRASVMTGRHPNRMGVFKWGYPLRPQETTIAEVLQQSGYVTGHFGKWHLGSVRRQSPAHPGHHGFDEWLSAPNFYDNDPIMSRRGEAVPLTGESSEIAVDAALEWITAASQKAAPLFATVWFGSPHSPHRAALQDRLPYRHLPAKQQHFFGEISGMDRAFGKLRQGIADLGLGPNTILWYCSDNGALPKVGSTGGHRGQKGSIYEGGLLVPSFIEWPAKIPASRVTQFRANTTDIYPTLLEAIGSAGAPARPLDGMSLLPLINAIDPPTTRSMGFWDYPARGIGTPSAQWMQALYDAQQKGQDLAAPISSQQAAKLPSPAYRRDSFPGHAAWIDGHWKLHRIQDKKTSSVRWELYDLATDPHEKNNVHETATDRARQLQTQLDAWLASVVDSLNGADYARANE